MMVGFNYLMIGAGFAAFKIVIAILPLKFSTGPGGGLS